MKRTAVLSVLFLLFTFLSPLQAQEKLEFKIQVGHLKHNYLFSLKKGEISSLNQQKISDFLEKEFAKEKISLSERTLVKVVKTNQHWEIIDETNKWIIKRENGPLNVYNNEFTPKKRVISEIPFAVRIRALRGGKVDGSFHEALQVEGELYTSNSEGDLVPLGSTGPFDQGEKIIQNVYLYGEFSLYYHGREVSQWSPPEGSVIPGLLSIIPPLLAIILAFIFREVVISLFLGIWVGVSFLYDYNPLVGLMRTLDTYVIQAMTNPDHAMVVFFSLMLGGMVGIIVKSGAMHSLVNYWSRLIGSRRGAQTGTWGMGLLIFFDDYANTLMVGQTMRPLTDKLKISREKLAYLVDSTAAPVASIAIISTWVGYELSFLSTLNVTPAGWGSAPDAFQVFLHSVPYRFYSIFTLFFVFLVAVSLRDFGTMRQAEIRAYQEGKIMRDGASPLQDIEEEHIEAAVATDSIPWYNALLPILVVIIAIFAGLYYNGWNQLTARQQETAAFWDIIGQANSLAVLCWCSTLGVFTAALLTRLQTVMEWPEVLQAWLGGVKSMVFAIVILVLAWTLGGICRDDLYTGQYIVEFTRGLLPLWLLPSLVFVVAGVVAFATGTSWGTMGILLPLVIPMTTAMLGESGYLQSGIVDSYGWQVLLASVAAVLAGSTFGDHCSPISDTTVMSSMASACDHIDHVRTQMPYALTTGGAAILLGYLPIGLGLPVWLSLAMGTAFLIIIIFTLGKKLPEKEETKTATSKEE